LFPVVTSDAAGAPELLLVVTTAPIAPEPLVPVVSTPMKVMTVIEEPTLWDRLAVTDTLLRGDAAKARQISEVPLWTLLLATSTQVKPAPETLVTVMFGVETEAVEINASSSSLPETVENAGMVIVELAVP
jgi:hypothetical protein